MKLLRKPLPIHSEHQLPDAASRIERVADVLVRRRDLIDRRVVARLRDGVEADRVEYVADVDLERLLEIGLRHPDQLHVAEAEKIAALHTRDAVEVPSADDSVQPFRHGVAEMAAVSDGNVPAPVRLQRMRHAGGVLDEL